MKLHEAIKQLIGQFGKGIVTEVRLANLLADLNGYEEYPAMKSVFKDLEKVGFGQKLYDSYCKNPDSTQDNINNYIRQCVEKTGYKEDLVSYGFDSILYGLGVLQIVNEPLSKGYDPKSKVGDILDTMDEQLDALKKQYLDSLDRLATKPNDILHDAPAYYSAEAQNKLYAIEAKIEVLQHELGKHEENDWCRNKKIMKLFDFKKEKNDTICKELLKLYSPYIERLYFLSSQVKEYTYSSTVFSSNDTLHTLETDNEKLFLLQKQMDAIDNSWRLKAISSRVVEEERKRKHAATTILNELKSKYSEVLEECLVLPQKENQTSKIHYDEKGSTCLSAIESCIKFAYANAEIAYDDWCKVTKDNVLTKCNKDYARKRLEGLKSEYLRQLDNLIIIPHKFFIKLSGYYDEHGSLSLSKLESQIRCACADSNTTYDNWCEKTKEGFLAKNKVEANNVIAQVVCKLGIPAAILVGATTTSISYTTSSDAIQRFERTISLGEQKDAANQYGEAMQLFSDAKAHYDGTFRSGHYESLANEHINSSIDKAVTDCQQLIDQGRLNDANNLLKSLPTKIITENTENSDKVNAVQKSLKKAIDEGLNKLITNISENKGHLDANAKEQLNELLAINPNDYWLNFIKNKEQ